MQLIFKYLIVSFVGDKPATSGDIGENILGIIFAKLLALINSIALLTLAMGIPKELDSPSEEVL